MYRGVVYDVGLRFSDQGLSVEPYRQDLVEHDMRAIADDLHANAVRIEGETIQRLIDASRAASAAGLTVFFNPWLMNATPKETQTYLAEAARAAEQLRQDGADINLLVSCEYSLFSRGVFPGHTFAERVQWFGEQLQSAGRDPSDPPDAIRERSKTLNAILGSLVKAARAEFKGPVTYCAGTWESVDWDKFDIVGVDFYRRGEPAEKYIGGLERYRLGKPLAVMEVGCCAYEGAAARGDGGFMIMQGVNPDGTGKWEGGVVPTRSEWEHADYVEEQVSLLAEGGVSAVFVYVFSFPTYKVGEGARDHDMAGFSLVKTFGDDDPKSKAMPPWEPKEAFHRLAEVYKKLVSQESVE